MILVVYCACCFLSLEIEIHFFLLLLVRITSRLCEKMMLIYACLLYINVMPSVKHVL